jgi:hypothetical protein
MPRCISQSLALISIGEQRTDLFGELWRIKKINQTASLVVLNSLT